MNYKCKDCPFVSTLENEAAEHHYELNHLVEYQSEKDGNWYNAFSD